MRKPKILVYDIETNLNKVLVFNTKDIKYIPPEAIIKNTSVLTIAYKWLDDADSKTKVISVGHNKVKYRKDPYDDTEVLSKFLPILEEADYLLAHYGDKFDMKYLAGRYFLNQLAPFPIVQTVDTCLLSKRHFKINSNKLDYIASQLGIGRKSPMCLNDWIGCTNSCTESIKKMEKYNIQDVLLLQEVFHKMLPYVQTKINLNHFSDSKHVCPQCGSMQLEKRGFYYNKATKKQRLKCKKCNHWSATSVEQAMHF
jgi:DNA polymerase III epsilon subunit-like protein